ncbi:hypothetical protein [Ensifer sp.]|jgi:hypothetical protein|uniref:hypothetical protein n=1 Tax=Ensifer sp. TaxID=1872086 RepID=UPI002E14FBCC|nr:hypothetical protein [Ensifer sp.]
MNQHEEFKDKPLVDPVTGQPLPRPQAETPMSDVPVEPPRRSNWPIAIILLAGLVLALIAWLPAELSRDTATTTPPAATDQPAATPSQNTTGQDTSGQVSPPADTSTAPSGGTTMQPAPTPETQGSTPNTTQGSSTPGTTPAMTEPAQ